MPRRRILCALGDTLAARGVRLMVCGGAEHHALAAEMERRGSSAVNVGAEAETALERCEDMLLAELGIAEDAPVPLAEGELCQRMSAAEVDDLRAAADEVVFAPGEVMLAEGDPSDHMLVIEEGRASILTVRDDGSPVRVLTIGPGMFTGEIGLLDGGPRSASVVADTAVRAHRLTRAGLERLSDDPALRTRTLLLLNVAESLSGHLRRATALLAAGRA